MSKDWAKGHEVSNIKVWPIFFKCFWTDARLLRMLISWYYRKHENYRKRTSPQILLPHCKQNIVPILYKCGHGNQSQIINILEPFSGYIPYIITYCGGSHNVSLKIHSVANSSCQKSFINHEILGISPILRKHFIHNTIFVGCHCWTPYFV